MGGKAFRVLQADYGVVDKMPSHLPQTAPGIPHPGTDPTPDELAALQSVDDVIKWLGMVKPVFDALKEELGTTAPKLHDIVFINAADWEQLGNDLRVPYGSSGKRVLKPMEKGHVEMVKRICRLRLSLPANEPSPADISGATVSDGSSPPSAAAVSQSVEPDAAVKLSAVWDPTLDEALNRMAPQAFRKLFTEYKTKRGAEPVEDIEPTLEQTSAAKQVIASDKAPYADFAVLGPYGRRLLQKLLYTVWHFQPDGTWKRQELPGPPNFDYWWASYKVLRCIFLLLDVASPEMLDNYGELIRSFVKLYKEQCWFLIYQADVRMRSEHFDRLRRFAERGERLPPGVTYDQQKPWHAIFHMAVEDTTWWDTNLHRPAMHFLTQLKSPEELTHDGTTQPQISAGDSPSSAAPRGRGTLRSRTRSPRRRSDRPIGRQQQQGGRSDSGAPSSVPWSLPNSDVFSKSNGRKFCDFYNQGTCRYDQNNCSFVHACKVCRLQGHGMHETRKCQGPRQDKPHDQGGKAGGRGAGKQRGKRGNRRNRNND